MSCSCRQSGRTTRVANLLGLEQVYNRVIFACEDGCGTRKKSWKGRENPDFKDKGMTIEEFDNLPAKQRAAMRKEYEQSADWMKRIQINSFDEVLNGSHFSHAGDGSVLMPGFFVWYHIKQDGKVTADPLD
jgi:hypothetical protein